MVRGADRGGRCARDSVPIAAGCRLILVALLILPAAVDGLDIRSAQRRLLIGRSPGRCAVAVAVTIVAYILGWVAALVLGFFVTGLVAAFLTWVVPEPLPLCC